MRVTSYGLDSAEAMQGEDFMLKYTLGASIPQVIKAGDTRLNIIKPSMRTVEHIREASTIHLKLVTIEGSICLYGEKPVTGIYNLEVVYSSGYPQVKLTPFM